MQTVVSRNALSCRELCWAIGALSEPMPTL